VEERKKVAGEGEGGGGGGAYFKFLPITGRGAYFRGDANSKIYGK